MAFRYFWNLPFVTGCAAYAVNRWILKPRFPGGFLHAHFNDLWLIPAALPPMLWVHRRLGLRSHDEPPRWSEIGLHLLVWSLICEVIGPHWVPGTTGDWRDVLAYATGAIAAGLWWQHAPRRQSAPSRR